MNNIENHPRFGDVCMCNCHRVGLEGFYHCFDGGCCGLENHSYLRTPTEPVDKESAIIAWREKGILDEELYSEILKEKMNKKPKKRKWKEGQ